MFFFLQGFRPSGHAPFLARQLLVRLLLRPAVPAPSDREVIFFKKIIFFKKTLLFCGKFVCCSPPLLVAATTSGTLYHCVALARDFELGVDSETQSQVIQKYMFSNISFIYFCYFIFRPPSSGPPPP